MELYEANAYLMNVAPQLPVVPHAVPDVVRLQKRQRQPMGFRKYNHGFVKPTASSSRYVQTNRRGSVYVKKKRSIKDFPDGGGLDLGDAPRVCGPIYGQGSSSCCSSEFQITGSIRRCAILNCYASSSLLARACPINLITKRQIIIDDHTESGEEGDFDCCFAHDGESGMQIIELDEEEELFEFDEDTLASFHEDELEASDLDEQTGSSQVVTGSTPSAVSRVSGSSSTSSTSSTSSSVTSSSTTTQPSNIKTSNSKKSVLLSKAVLAIIFLNGLTSLLGR